MQRVAFGGPDRPAHDLRAGDQRGTARPGRGLSPLGGSRTAAGSPRRRASGTVERGFWIEPTVIAGLDNYARAAREEIFGPVLVVLAHDGDEDAVRIANDSPYGLSGVGHVGRYRPRAGRGRSHPHRDDRVNGGVWFSADAPFGGYKQSGIGREMGVAGFEEYLQTKLVAELAGTDRRRGPMTHRRFEGKVAIVTGAGAGHRRGLRPGARRGRGRRSSSPMSTSNGHARREGPDRVRRRRALFVETDVSSPESDARDGWRRPSRVRRHRLARQQRGDLRRDEARRARQRRLGLLQEVHGGEHRRRARLHPRGACKQMAARGGGAIVNQSSTAAWLYSGFYGLAKVGINGLTQQLAHELGWSATSASTRSRPARPTPRRRGPSCTRTTSAR